MGVTMRSFFRHLHKRGQSGQSLVILAIGFLALLGFVGIVTDVSVLFIRYNTMRRAVDAAAIAAAGQMRRVADPTPGDANADDEAISVANLNLAARQFIEVYGLNPKSVIVETCRAQQVARDDAGTPYDNGGNPSGTDPNYPYTDSSRTTINPAAHKLFNADGTVNSAADPAVVERYKQLCTPDELKLVRVTAQIDAPTIFLRLLGYPTVTLTESAISQTAVLDVVMIFDVSESMLNQTTYNDWDTLNPPEGVRYMPPFINYSDHGWEADPLATPTPVPARDDPWRFIADNTEGTLNTDINPSLVTPNYIIGDKTIAFEPTGADPLVPPDAGSSDWQVYTDQASSPAGRVQPRDFCQVRAYSATAQNRSLVQRDLRQQYYDFFNNVYQSLYPGQDYVAQFTGVGYPDTPQPQQDILPESPNPPVSSAYFWGFVPMYNSFACCNDPNGDWVFDDLICQPFKDARDAAHGFLDRLDFLRGDRVAYVTFDRRAYVVDPDGADIIDPTDGHVDQLRWSAEQHDRDAVRSAIPIRTIPPARCCAKARLRLSTILLASTPSLRTTATRIIMVSGMVSATGVALRSRNPGGCRTRLRYDAQRNRHRRHHRQSRQRCLPG